MRHHTTGPIPPVRRVAAVTPVAPHRRDAPARAKLERAVRFYRSKLRAQADAKQPR